MPDWDVTKDQTYAKKLTDEALEEQIQSLKNLEDYEALVKLIAQQRQERLQELRTRCAVGPNSVLKLNLSVILIPT